MAAPARTYPTEDIHAAQGFGCLACHGPGAGDLRGAAGFLRKPARREIPGLCGRCHADASFMRDYAPSMRVDQVDEYWTSVHGRLLRDENDPDVATCTSCHPAHEIRPPSDPESTVHPLHVADLCGSCHGDETLMRARGHSSDEPERYRSSVHARLLYEDGDLSAPTCNDCHGNHGAAPPGMESVRNVCGQCHVTMADDFAESGHVEPFDVDERPGCVACHGNHAIQRPADTDLRARSRTVCASCHAESDDPHGGEFLVMASLLDSLMDQRELAESTLQEAEDRGMYVSRAQFELQDVTDALTRARTAIHTFHVDPVREQVEAGLDVTSRALERGRQALAEHRFRRVGLAFSSLLILALITGLVFKIREIERPTRAPRDDRSNTAEGSALHHG